ncbi:hypothetical protein ACQP2F_20640 [Actinoplanes sp. CA-030573]|uniref:hypothetical protein n=1 Tax=Actinoplanes sp. CA-030573 TaxID=3239898 RepID=UPI003D89B6F2
MTRLPAVVIVLVAPFLGEVLPTATPPLGLLLPWNLALMAALYGSGALLCRELTRRYRLGLPGLCLLAAAYAVYEEALVDRYWFDPHYWQEAGVGSYGRVWHTNILLASHLTAFHVAVSIGASIVLVEALFPAYRNQPWVGRPGLALAAAALAAVAPITYEEYAHVPRGQLIAATALGAVLVASAFLLRRRPFPPPEHTAAGRPANASSPLRRPVLPGVIAFACTAAHFVLVYAVPSTGLPWPAGTAVALAPIAAGVVLLGRGAEALTVVTGILGFFLLLDAAVGLGGRYDLTAGALVMAAGLWWLVRREGRRRRRPVAAATGGHGD